MRTVSKALGGILTITLMTNSVVHSEEPDREKITEKDQKTSQEFVETVDKKGETQEKRVLQTVAVMNLRQIGMALFEFETEYGSFPNAKTAVEVKNATGSTADLKAATANDCFYQMMTARIVQNERLFTFEDARNHEQVPAKLPDHLEKCVFSYFIGMDASGHPGRPLVVAPLVKGKRVFDPEALGGRAVVLRVDNSVQSFPIGEDGTVKIDGLDIFDPKQPFWNGKVPEIRWPKE